MSGERAPPPPPASAEDVDWIGVAAGRGGPVPEPDGVPGEATSGKQEAVSGWEAELERGEVAAEISMLVSLSQ